MYSGYISQIPYVFFLCTTCSPEADRLRTFKVRAGEHDKAGNLETKVWTYDLARVIPHPDYQKGNQFANDIALIKTKDVRIL